MNTSLKSIQPRMMALVAGAGVLLALLPVASVAQNNTAYGVGALKSGTARGIEDSAFGVDALFTTSTGGYNTATGFSALYSNTSGDRNTATGVNALLGNTSGAYNTATGVSALSSNTTGVDNTAEGYQALHNCTTDSENTATGYQALFSDTTLRRGFGGYYYANGNVADGFQALYSNKIGFGNVGVGFTALFMNDSDGSGAGSGNTAVGDSALGDNVDGSYSTAVGISALESATNGYNNVAIGQYAGSVLTNGSNNIYIGDNANDKTDDKAVESNTIRIGEVNSQTNATYVAGIWDASVSNNAQPVYVEADGKLGTYLIIAGPNSHPAPGQMGSPIDKLAATVAAQAKALAQQQEEIKNLTASLKEQASMLRKVSAEVQLNRPAPRMVSNDH